MRKLAMRSPNDLALHRPVNVAGSASGSLVPGDCVARRRGGREELHLPASAQYRKEVCLASLNRELAARRPQCNHFRSHQALALDTPVEYLKRLGDAA